MRFKNIVKFEEFLIEKGYIKQDVGHLKDTVMKQNNTLNTEIVCYTKEEDEVSVIAIIGDEEFQCIHKVTDDYIE